MSFDASISNQILAEAIQSEMNVLMSPGLRDAVNFDESGTMPIHRWFRYREGFSPTILEKFNGHQRIFDPFCGCGTTLIEAKKIGVDAIGADVNPLAVFVAKVKTRQYSATDAEVFASWAIRASECQQSWSVPAIPLLPKLFQEEALEELLRLRMGLERCEDEKIRDLLFLCWLNILEGCSNVFKEGNGLKYRNKKRQRGKYETVSDDVWIPRRFGRSICAFVRQRWHSQCLLVREDLAQLRVEKPSVVDILERSCLDPDLPEEVQTCDASVFSPPYANRFDYFEAFKVELWMGNFVGSFEEMGDLRNRSMRNNLAVQTGEVSKRQYVEDFLDLMDDSASSVRMGIRQTLRGYFDDVALLAGNLRRILAPSGKVVCVVGNSAYAGVLIPTDLLCGIIFEEVGFDVESIEVARPLHVSSQQRGKMSTGLEQYMRESVISCTL